jgi:hypothetical protein
MAQSDQGHKGLLEQALISFFFEDTSNEMKSKAKEAYGPLSDRKFKLKVFLFGCSRETGYSFRGKIPGGTLVITSLFV